jgi:hypothetical protein
MKRQLMSWRRFRKATLTNAGGPPAHGVLNVRDQGFAARRSSLL